jgi:hypothetical protein
MNFLLQKNTWISFFRMIHIVVEFVQNVVVIGFLFAYSRLICTKIVWKVSVHTSSSSYDEDCLICTKIVRRKVSVHTSSSPYSSEESSSSEPGWKENYMVCRKEDVCKFVGRMLVGNLPGGNVFLGNMFDSWNPFCRETVCMNWMQYFSVLLLS